MNCTNKYQGFLAALDSYEFTFQAPALSTHATDTPSTPFTDIPPPSNDPSDEFTFDLSHMNFNTASEYTGPTSDVSHSSSPTPFHNDAGALSGYLAANTSNENVTIYNPPLSPQLKAPQK
jgi:hypothetical protein